MAGYKFLYLAIFRYFIYIWPIINGSYGWPKGRNSHITASNTIAKS
jgi:hypothetical protein